jgi:protein O-mannosyl-transferase
MKKQRGATRAGKARHREKARVAQPPRLASSIGRSELLIAAALAVASLAVYGQVVSHQFINFDDDLYIRDNPMVNGGLTLEGIAWAFTTFHSAIWHPLTWLSHMLDSQLFGLNAGGHLLVNALIHTANTLLLFLFLKRVTGARWRSALVAALFALHPLHVESVAWAAERKDTLSTFFGLLCLLAYARYVERPSRKKYALVAVWLALGLMAKPMLLSWPFVLLLLDYWPLRRIEWQPADSLERFSKAWWPLVREKLPLFFLITPYLVLTYIAQAREGAVADLVAAPLSWRLANSLISYGKYLLMTFWPDGLAMFYPAPLETAPVWQWNIALICLGAITALALRNARKRSYWIVGWLWFLGTLLPVIGLVQVGAQAMADRYTYIPSIGLFAVVVFGLADLAKTWRIGSVYIATASAVTILLLALLTTIQISRWRDSETLFAYVLSVTSDNSFVQNNLGTALGQQGKHAEAIPHFVEALRIKPNYADALENMGLALWKQGKAAEAIGFYQRALRVKPQSVKAHWGLGQVLAEQGKNDDAVQEVMKAAELAPSDGDIRRDLGRILARQGKISEAIAQLNEVLRLNPTSAEAHNDLGVYLQMAGQPEGSLAHFSAALRLKPDMSVAQDNLKRAQNEIDGRKK